MHWIMMKQQQKMIELTLFCKIFLNPWNPVSSQERKKKKQKIKAKQNSMKFFNVCLLFVCFQNSNLFLITWVFTGNHFVRLFLYFVARVSSLVVFPACLVTRFTFLVELMTNLGLLTISDIVFLQFNAFPWKFNSP